MFEYVAFGFNNPERMMFSLFLEIKLHLSLLFSSYLEFANDVSDFFKRRRAGEVC
jgi:hypothetical protein